MRPLLVGVCVAAALIAILAVAGDRFFLPTTEAFQANFVAGALVGLALGAGAARLSGRPAAGATRAAALVAVPGLLTMAAVASHFGVAFPALDRDLDKVFGSWMLWFYGFALIGALLVEGRARRGGNA